ncbi:Isoprenylcysteine alpha-carbonyl methylesterase ICME [Linum grandiflorum]
MFSLGSGVQGGEGRRGPMLERLTNKSLLWFVWTVQLTKFGRPFPQPGSLSLPFFESIMDGEESLPKFSPEARLKHPRAKDAVSRLPPIVLFHGTADKSIPSCASEAFVEALGSLGADAELVLFEGKTHTDLFLQDPLRGGKDELFDRIVACIHAGDAEALAEDAKAPGRRRLVPELLLRLAGNISPF